MTRGSGLRRRAFLSKRWRTAIALVGVSLTAGALPGTVAGAEVTVSDAEVTVANAVTPPSAQYVPITVHTRNYQYEGRWGERTRVTADYNGDGVKEIWVGVPQYKRDDVPYGRVFLMDGAEMADPQGNKNRPKPRAVIHPPEPQATKQFGFWIEVPGDLNGDGVPELVVGTDAQDVPWDPTENSQVCESHPERCNQNQGKAWVFDGKTNDVLYELNNPRPQGSPNHQARFSSRIGRAGDVNGNGVADIIVGASGNDNPESWSPANGGDGCSDDGVVEPGCRRGEGQAFIFEGSNGALIRELDHPVEDENPPTTCSSFCGSVGLAVQGPGDVDGDGVTDQLVAAATYTFGALRGQGRMYVYSGATGQVIRKIDPPQPDDRAFFGFQDVTPLDPGDVNGDGKADLYGGAFFMDGEGGPGQGKAWVFSGAGGPEPGTTPVLYEVQNPNRLTGQAFGWSATRDRNRGRPGDPADDSDPVTNPLYVGNAPHHTANGRQQGETNTFNAATGAHAQTLPLPLPWATEPGQPINPDLGPNLGWNVSSPGDLNHDGFRDFVAGAPFTNVCEVMLGDKNKKLNRDQGVIISFRSSPTGAEVDPGNNDPGDNVCTEANNQ